MERLGIYKILFFTLLFFYLFFQTGFVDSLVTFTFILATIFLIFTREVTIEKNQEQVEYPEVHYYSSTRYNPYTYIMVLATIFSALLFSLLQVLTNLRIGIISFIAWFIILLTGELIKRKINKSLDQYLIADYIQKTIPEDLKIIRFATDKIYNLEDDKKIEEVLKNITDWPSSIRKKFIKRYLEYKKYLQDTNKQELVSGEIEELNKK